MKKLIYEKMTGIVRLFALLVLPLAAPLLISLPVSAQAANVGGAACYGTNLTFSATGNTTCTDSTPQIQKIITDVVNIFSVVVGLIAVIMIIIGGFRYITGGGSGDVSGAKNTIVYALIGLVIVALAQVIVHFVLYRSTTAAVGG
jgi:hypothetical protein